MKILLFWINSSLKSTFMGWKAKDKPEKNKTQSKNFPLIQNNISEIFN